MSSTRFLVTASLMPEQSQGWTRGLGDVVCKNLKVGVQVLHVAWAERLPDGKLKFLYDQILRAEAGGGMSLVIDERHRLGLQKAWRPQTPDQNAWQKSWPDIDLESLGRASWELPRGFANISKAGKAESGSDAATRETEEETGSKVTSTTPLGEVCDNTASSPHMTVVQMATVDLNRPSGAAADPNEKFLAPLTFFTRVQLAQMVVDGEIYCAYTLAAIAKWLLLEYLPVPKTSGKR